MTQSFCHWRWTNVPDCTVLISTFEKIVSLSNFCLREKRFLKNKEYSTSPTQSCQTKCWLMSIFFRTILSDNHSITINAFVPNAPSLNPLRTSESLTVFWCFRGVEKGCIGNKWVNTILYIRIMLFLLFYLLPLLLLLLKLQHRFKLLLTIKETYSTHLISLNLKKAPLV